MEQNSDGDSEFLDTPCTSPIRMIVSVEVHQEHHQNQQNENPAIAATCAIARRKKTKSEINREYYRRRKNKQRIEEAFLNIDKVQSQSEMLELPRKKSKSEINRDYYLRRKSKLLARGLLKEATIRNNLTITQSESEGLPKADLSKKSARAERAFARRKLAESKEISITLPTEDESKSNICIKSETNDLQESQENQLMESAVCKEETNHNLLEIKSEEIPKPDILFIDVNKVQSDWFTDLSLADIVNSSK